MSAMVKCQHCEIQLREDRCKKHHAKVHYNLPFNLMYYKEDMVMDQKPDEVDAQTIDNDNDTTNAGDNNLMPSTVENEMENPSAHIRCKQCSNMMPADAMDNHMKRKHSPGPVVTSYPLNVAFSKQQAEKAELGGIPFMTKPAEKFDSENESLYNIQVTADQLLKLFRQQKVYSKRGALRLTDL